MSDCPSLTATHLTGTLSKPLFGGKERAEKRNQLCVEQKAGVWRYSCKSWAEREGDWWWWWCWWSGGGGGIAFHITFNPIPKRRKKRNWGWIPQNRLRLKVADSKLLLFAIRQLSSNVWDDTASILFIDYQQETLSILTMCATWKSPCCRGCLLFFLTSSLSQKNKESGGGLTWKWTIQEKPRINIHSCRTRIVKKK